MLEVFFFDHNLSFSDADYSWHENTYDSKYYIECCSFPLLKDFTKIGIYEQNIDILPP